MVDAFRKPGAARTRRELFRSIGMAALGGGSAAVLAACSGPSSRASANASAAPITLSKSAVPSGSGVIKGAYVVTQPTAGDYKAFTSTCTHEGCPVSSITGDAIMCNCHGSQFSIKDGSVLHGPATKALPTRTITADGAELTVS